MAYIMDETLPGCMYRSLRLVQVMERYENMFRHFDWKYHGRGICTDLLFDEGMSHTAFTEQLMHF